MTEKHDVNDPFKSREGPVAQWLAVIAFTWIWILSRPRCEPTRKWHSPRGVPGTKIADSDWTFCLPKLSTISGDRLARRKRISNFR